MEEGQSRGILTSPTSNLSIGAIYREECSFAFEGCEHAIRKRVFEIDVSWARCGLPLDEDNKVMIEGWNLPLPLPPGVKQPYCGKHDF